MPIHHIFVPIHHNITCFIPKVAHSIHSNHSNSHVRSKVHTFHSFQYIPSIPTVTYIPKVTRHMTPYCADSSKHHVFSPKVILATHTLFHTNSNHTTHSITHSYHSMHSNSWHRANSYHIMHTHPWHRANTYYIHNTHPWHRANTYYILFHITKTVLLTP